MRSTVINIFRIPLNLFVCIVLYNVRTAAASTTRAGAAHRKQRWQAPPPPPHPPMSPWTQVNAFPLAFMFGMCSLFLVGAAYCQRRFSDLVHEEQVRAHRRCARGCARTLLS